MEALDLDWSKYPNFKPSEFQCSHTGLMKMDHNFMVRLQNLRNILRKPIVVVSGYRDVTHPKEVAKQKIGSHSLGRAVDISVSGSDAINLISAALLCGFTGIGVSQIGQSRFIHLDDLKEVDGFVRPTIWSY